LEKNLKTKVVYFCQDCGAAHPKWQGQCSECGHWNTLLEETTSKTSKSLRNNGYAGAEAALTSLSEVSLLEQPRHSTGLFELDHALGGGLVSDSAVLIGGDPGIGKSTLLLQVLSKLSEQYRSLYVSGEESPQQIAMRAHRLGNFNPDLTLLAETNVEKIIQVFEQFQPKLVVIDSVQTIFLESVSAAPGSVSQIRESTAHLIRYVKNKNIALLLVGHVTKEGVIAGPRVLEHMVDVVLYFEGSTDSRYRIIRAVKNRFGAVNEIGVFAMTDKGLKQVNNPSAIFLSGCAVDVAGSSILAAWEGSRPILVEIQALVDDSALANPRRVTVGLDSNRLSMLLAVLHRHAGVATHGNDVFVNVVGGIRVSETAADLAILLSVLSSLKNKALPRQLLVFGEVGLSGEIRPVPCGQDRLKEAAKQGFKKAIVPKGNLPKQVFNDMEVIGVEKLAEALTYL
jgi:DNA repair protein RadA/Sms